MSPPINRRWLTAEIEAWPIASRAALDLGLVSLEQSGPGCPRGPSEQLSHALEDWIRPRSGGLSLDVLRLQRDRAWYSPGGDAHVRSLVDYTLDLAQRFLDDRGAEVRVSTVSRSRVSPQTNVLPFAEHVAQWRWLSFSLPPDLLIACLAAARGHVPHVDHVSLSAPPLRQILERPVAETHLHIGAAPRFPLMWTGLMVSLRGRDFDPKRFVSGGPSELGDAQSMLRWLLVAGITRLLLAGFLWARAQSNSRMDFAKALPGWLDGRMAYLGHGRTRPTLLGALAYLDAPHGEAPGAAVLARAYRRLCGVSVRRQASTLSAVVARDPLALWMPYRPGEALPETRFCAEALRYCAGVGADDVAFTRLFWQYERVRSLMYRYLVERPGTRGLDWFTRHYKRISALRGTLDPVLFEIALRGESRGATLSSLEVRTSPERSWAKNRALLARYAAQALEFRPGRADNPEVGLVLHYIKARGGAPPYADPRASVLGCAYADWFLGQERGARAIATLLRRRPEYLALLRGVDIANLELSVPSWVVGLLISAMREAAVRASEQLKCIWPQFSVRPLDVTLHCGEEFRRLHEGLRRVHEPLEFGLLRNGDRVGHGLALGVDPVAWCRKHPVSIQPAIERLDDLLWELGLYRTHGLEASATRLERVRDEIAGLGRLVYAEDVSIEILYRARVRLHDVLTLRRLGYPRVDPTVPRSDLVDKILVHRLCDSGVYCRGSQPIECVADLGEREFLEQAQRLVLAKFATSSMTVESNPSSNLLIGEVGSLEHHPAFRIMPVRGPARVNLSVNVDNPLTFNSNIADEYAYLYYSLLRAGATGDEATRWIDSAREVGWRSRFTVNESRDRRLLRRLASRS